MIHRMSKDQIELKIKSMVADGPALKIRLKDDNSHPWGEKDRQEYLEFLKENVKGIGGVICKDLEQITENWS